MAILEHSEIKINAREERPTISQDTGSINCDLKWFFFNCELNWVELIYGQLGKWD